MPTNHAPNQAQHSMPLANTTRRQTSQHPPSTPTGTTLGVAAGRFVAGGWDVLRRPSVAAFDRQRVWANWTATLLGLVALALVEALGVAYVIYGPDAAAGYSSLPVGPKLLLPRTPLLPLAAFLGSPAQFLVFTGLLHLSARPFGGAGDFKAQAYLLALFWVPLMMASDLVELLPGIGSAIGMVVRLYALYLCALAIASAQRLALGKAWAALLVPVACGLLVGVAALAFVWPHLQGLVPMR